MKLIFPTYKYVPARLWGIDVKFPLLVTTDVTLQQNNHITVVSKCLHIEIFNS